MEDEVHLAEALRDGLVAEGFAVDLAFDGERGLELALAHPYDAIVLDLMLPRRHGYDVCRTLRRSGVWTPVLMLTAKDGEYDQADALDLGVDAYLTKPSSFVVVLATLRALVRRQLAERPAVLRVGPLELDPAEHRVRVRGQPMQLRPREFALLHYLMRRPGEAVSKSDILANVWDEFYEGDPNIVEVYVSYLRRKIGAVEQRSVIETIRGVGYRLSVLEG
ncbi:MAG: transcriptional regulator [Frankiales bacterium]|nr:transcriptional regulator [Frankiales bacterium]